jgi:HlyD family secretion protein
MAARDLRRQRPAVVFVLNAQGVPEPRRVMIGLNDWDNTEVVSGLEGDERLAVIGPAQLQAQQQEFLNRIRQRGGGSPFGR